MSNRISAILILVLMSVASPLIAQAPTETPDVFAIATQLIAEATQTAAAQPAATEADDEADPFILTATAFVAQVTQTAAASGIEPDSQPTLNPLFSLSEEDFELTATQIIADVTATAGTEANAETDSPPASSSSGGCAPAVIVPMIAGFFALTWTNKEETERITWY